MKNPEPTTSQTPRDGAPTSLWQLKPWWCQPWSIVAVGIAIPTGSWLLAHQLWLTGGIAFLISAWWWLFLIRVPRQYARELGSRSGADRSK